MGECKVSRKKEIWTKKTTTTATVPLTPNRIHLHSIVIHKQIKNYDNIQWAFVYISWIDYIQRYKCISVGCFDPRAVYISFEHGISNEKFSHSTNKVLKWRRVFCNFSIYLSLSPSLNYSFIILLHNETIFLLDFTHRICFCYRLRWFVLLLDSIEVYNMMNVCEWGH